MNGTWKLIISGSLLCLLALTSVSASAEQFLYRYINDKGVKVLTQRIPAEYSQKGYEIINSKGQVIKVVPPAPSEEQIAKLEEKRILQKQYERLRNRYSNIDQIEAARRRKLENIESNIALLKGNISSLTIQLENFMSSAADSERAGRTVSPRLLQNIKDTRAELKIANEQLDARVKEHDEVTARFDEDVAIFQQGATLK